MPYKDKKQQSKYQVEWAKKNRQLWLDTNGPCVQCGSFDNLEVDHIDPATKVTHRVWFLSPYRRALELQKCQVLCSSCHKRKTTTYRRTNPRPIQHGHASGYWRDCRCEPCVDAYRERKKTWPSSLGVTRRR